ncbi:unnamed protein product [Rhizoctonia solani]|uniref:WD40 repeat-like protein n=1 Tax=Rhizoctonia solani TaxID=456999 RepID=A0A8H3CIU3_9AGAM|nr:unnamed protein product [Rhizoctonia solani]
MDPAPEGIIHYTTMNTGKHDHKVDHDQADTSGLDLHPGPDHELGSTSDVSSRDDPPISSDAVDRNHNENRGPNSSPPGRSNSTPLAQLQHHGAVNAHLVNFARKQLETEGVKIFEDLNQEAEEVDAALRLLGSSMQLFGSSVGVLHAIYQLRKSLLRLQFHFGENAAFLYEDSVKPNEKRYACEVKPDMKFNGQINEPDLLTQKRNTPNFITEKTSNMPQTMEIDTDTKYELRKVMGRKRYRTIGGSMEQVNETLKEFIERINEISGFHDELINRSFGSFAEELNYRVDAFKRLNYQPNKAFKEHINKLAAVFGHHLRKMNHALKNFQKNSIPIIQRFQEHRSLGLQGLSAVATFFSGITASTIQYQLDDTSTSLQGAVNGLWIMSLACSIASAVSAQVVYFWRTSRFSSPSKYTPGIIGRVLQYTPLVYLCCAVSTFMVGLSVFTFSSDQHIVISVLIAAFTGLVAFELVVFGLWITLERIAYSWTRGKSWFLQVHSHLVSDMWTYMVTKLEPLIRPRATTPGMNDQAPGSNVEQGLQPSDQQPIKEQKPGRSASDRMRVAIRKIMQHQRDEKLKVFREQYLPRRQTSTYITHAQKQAGIGRFELSVVSSQHNGLIKHLAFNPKDPLLLATCGWDGKALVSRIGNKMSTEVTLNHDRDIHGQSSAQLQGGQQLFGRPLNEDTCVREVAWSLDGKKLATRTRKAVRIWDIEPENAKTGAPWSIVQPPKGDARTVEAIAWTSCTIQNAKGKKKEGDEVPCLLMMGYTPKAGQRVVGSTAVVRYCLNAQDTQSNSGMWTSGVEKEIRNTRVISMAVVDESKLIAVGVDTEGSAKFEAEKYLLLFNYVLGEIMSIVPLTGEVRSVSVTISQRSIATALVSYKHQGAYPQLWRINLIPNPLAKDQSTNRRDFFCIRSYFPKATSDFSGRGCFGGPDDAYVCCSSQEGEIFIWDRETGLLLYTIKPVNDEHIKFFTCNKQARPNFKCASGAVDGILSVWTTTDRPGNAAHTPVRQATGAVSSSAPLYSESQPLPMFPSPRLDLDMPENEDEPYLK